MTTGYPLLRERFAHRREEGFGFAVSFLEALRLEFFKPRRPPVPEPRFWAARWARPCSMARLASSPASASKRRPFSKSSRNCGTSAGTTRTLRFLPFSQH